MDTSAAVHSARGNSEVLEMRKRIGKGTYGTVFIAFHRALGFEVACKVIPIGKQMDSDSIMAEVRLLSTLRHPNIVGYHGTMSMSRKMFVCMDLCESGSLLDYMKRQKAPLNDVQVASAARQSLQGLHYLHNLVTPPVLHRDIKAGNLLLNSAGEVKLSDFGISAPLDSALGRSTQTGSPYWMAPEILDEQRYHQPVDIWSLGITLIELAEMNPPFYDMGPIRAMYKLTTGDPPELSDPAAHDPQLSALLALMLVKEPEERATAQALLEHPWITGALPTLPILSDFAVSTPRGSSPAVATPPASYSSLPVPAANHDSDPSSSHPIGDTGLGLAADDAAGLIAQLDDMSLAEPASEAPHSTDTAAASDAPSSPAPAVEPPLSAEALEVAAALSRPTSASPRPRPAFAATIR